MRRELRLRQRRHFDAVFQKGRIWSNRLLVLRALSNNLPHNRFGFVTSKRVGNAVARNKTRRRLREAVRSLHTGTGWDVVVAARPSAAAATFAELKRAVADLLARAMIIAEDASPEGERA